jgi:hypothetical protein
VCELMLTSVWLKAAEISRTLTYLSYTGGANSSMVTWIGPQAPADLMLCQCQFAALWVQMPMQVPCRSRRKGRRAWC